MQLYGRWSVLMLVIGIPSIFITLVFIWEKVQQRQCVTNLSNYANNTQQLIRRKIHHFSDYHDHTDNVWWQLMHQTVRKIRNYSCYVCCFIPHAINDQTFLVPVPIDTAYSLATLFPDNRLVEVIFPWVRNYTLRESRNVSRFSSETNLTCANTGTLYRFWGNRNPIRDPDICIAQEENTPYFLGKTEGYKTIIPVSCALTHRNTSGPCPIRTDPYTISGSSAPEPFVLTLNLTALPNGSKMYGQAGKLTRALVTFPSRDGYSCPKNMVWMCGNRSYLHLPANWSMLFSSFTTYSHYL
ncbi:hypothetical protein AMECASPLE_032662 [Ameca splendens]|uniref:Uncharacterized protein n=1 Tax=Ameca splendens TaxID=208324 RepID=A0ABV0Y6I6_9TELE